MGGPAAGVRNSVGFDWQPGTESMWATTNARDNLDPDHNNRPDDYLMWLPYSGKDFGFPFVSPSCWWLNICHIVTRFSSHGLHKPAAVAPRICRLL